jgi:hypothetical protein
LDGELALLDGCTEKPLETSGNHSKPISGSVLCLGAARKIQVVATKNAVASSYLGTHETIDQLFRNARRDGKVLGLGRPDVGAIGSHTMGEDEVACYIYTEDYGVIVLL